MTPSRPGSTMDFEEFRATLPSPAIVARRDPLTITNSLIGPVIPDGSFIYGMYDAVNYTTARAARPFFTTDSKYTLTSWPRLRAMSLARWSYINVPVVKAMVDLLGRLTVGTGFKPVSKGGNKGIGRLYDAFYLAATQNIDFRGGASMDELLLHDCRASDVDGDLGYVLTQDETGAEKLQFIEGHRIGSGRESDPRCRDGVWVDPYDRIAGFNVRLPSADEDVDNFTRISVRDFHYMAERQRPDELRSMTNLIHALNPLQDLYEIMAFATASAKKNAETGTVIETPTPNDLPGGWPRGMMVRPAQPAAGGQPAVPAQVVTYEQVFGGGGKTIVLRPGEKFQSFAHNHPAPTLEAWGEFIIRNICNGRGIPFEIVWNPEKIGGANTRMLTALLRAFLVQRRRFLIFPKLSRTRLWILSRAIKAGKLPFDPDGLFNVTWQPNFIDITVDAGRESRERRANVQCGLDTFTSYDAENGNDYLGDSLPAREAEADAQCEAAERLSKKHAWLDPNSALNRIAQLTPNGSGAAAVAPSGPGAADPPAQ